MQGTLKLPFDKDYPSILLWRDKIYQKEVMVSNGWPDDDIDNLKIDQYRHYTFEKGQRDAELLKIRKDDTYFDSHVKIIIISDDADDIRVDPKKVMFDGSVFISEEPNALLPNEYVGLFRTPNMENLKSIIDKVIKESR